MAHTYTRTDWETRMAITKERMNNIEDGIVNAYQDITTNSDNITNTSTKIRDLTTRVGDDETLIDNLRSEFSSITTNSQDGSKAWQQVSGAITMNGDVVTQSLNERIGATESKIGNITTEIEGARKGENNLRGKIDAIDTDITRISGSVTTIEEKFASAKGTFNTVEDRFAGAEANISTLQNDMQNVQQEIVEGRGTNGSSLNNRFTNIESQLANAKESSAKDTIFGSIDGRFEEIETEIINARSGSISIDARLDNIDDLSRDNSLVKRMANAETNLGNLNTYMVEAQGNISSLQSGKVNTADVVNDVTIDTSGKVLDARVGKTLQDQITILQTSASTDGDRIDALEEEVGMAQADGSRRLDVIEGTLSDLNSEITNAHTSAANNDTYNSIDERLEADEGRIGTLETDVNDVTTLANTLHTDVQTIANELNMISNDQIVDTNSRIDTLETAIENLQTTTGDMSEFGGRITQAEQDIDALETTVSSLNTTVTGTNGLTERMTTAESDIDTLQSGLSDVTTAVGNAATQTAVNTLAGRVTTLEGKDTVIISDATFDAETGMPIISDTPSETCDYLIKGTDNKYYYWRYLGQETGWQLISGGGGAGNSSGYDFETMEDYAALEEHSENTDYYVQAADGVHHYRWVQQTDIDTGETSLVEIEIGCVTDTSNIRKYNVAVETLTNELDGTTTNYLNFYEFNADESNEIDENDEEGEIARLVNKRIRHILLPATGGGGGSVSTMKFTRITPRLFTSAINGDQPIKVQFFFTTGEANDGAYYDLYIGRIVNNSVVDERKVLSDVPITSGDPEDKSTTWPTSSTIPQGFYEINVSQYFNQVGYYSIRLQARQADNTSVTGGINWELHTINFYLTSTSGDGLIVDVNEPVSLEYRPYGAIEKTLHVVIDGDTEHEITHVISERTSGTSSTIAIPSQTHGLHKIDMYMTAVINNVTVPTQHIYREYIWYDPQDSTAAPIIVASAYNNQTIAVDAYTEFHIPYSVYYKEDEDYLIEYYLNYGTANEKNLGRIQARGNVISYFDYIPITADNSVETQVITIKVADQAATITLTVSPIEQDVSPISGAIIDFDPSTLTNSSLNREPEWKTNTRAYDEYEEWIPGGTYGEGANVIYNGYAYTCRTAHRDATWTPEHWTEQGAYKYYLKVSDNFNWSNDASGGGYKEDDDGKCFVIKAGSYADINYKMFKSNGGQSAIYDTGAEMKIIFKTMAVRKADAVWFSNAKTVNDKQIGIQLSAHSGWLKTDKASDGSVTAQDNYADWESGTSYLVGAVVVYDRANDGTIYKCTKANSDDEFNDKNWLKIGKIEGKVDATNTYLYFPYSEEDKIELDIDINKYIASENNNFIMSYEDGVPSKALPYTYGPGGDGLYHPNGEEATIHIGSPDCDVYIYRLRIYNKSLGTDEILQNFIADGKSIQEKVQRYERNCIYWDEEQHSFFTTTAGTAKLDPIKLAEKMPNVKVLMLDCPTFTLNKKSYIKDSSLRCLQIKQDANGNFVYPEEGNWFFQHGYHAGQGTTSDNYGQSGRNVDFLFNCDGTNYPANSKDVKDYVPGENYHSTLLRGNDTSKWVVVDHNDVTDTDIYGWQAVDGAEEETCTGWKDDECKVQLTPTSVPNNYFNLKVNIASSENVNNALFQKRYSEFVAAVNPSPATANQEAQHHYSQDDRFAGPITVKNSMEFVPAVLFVRERDPDTSKHSEFNDCEWHFYALGNIGDSKKTDYTRAYDPTDMNEFTLEISDNNTKNSQFQSGLYKVNGVDTVEQADSGTNTMNYLWGLSDEQWNATRSPNEDELAIRAQINAGEEDLVDVIMDGEQADGSDGQVYVNYRHRMLHAEPFDGDHSFEFRYACQGDYRDGKLINPSKNDTDPERVARYKADKAQEKLNRKVFEAFYTWLVTANEDQFRDEAALWFVPGAMEFFYAYTHYYTMMDSRAKNTFWHFAKTGSRRAVPIGRAVKDLMHVYEVKDGDNYVPASGDFDNSTQYYTQYAFDLWAYDMDTAAGIDNNGALVFPYGKEDSDYRTEGDPLSGMAFNGAGSIFWRRLSKTFASDIRTIMTSTPVNCFNSQHLINEFDATQECFPEEVWRLDIERKYIRTFTGKSYDNSLIVGKQNPRFLRSMMQGRKKYQRRQWIRDQGVYFNSKYRLNDIIQNDNTIEFNATTPAVPEWQANIQYYINDYVRTKVEPFDELKPKFKVYRCIEANNDSSFIEAHWQASVTPAYLLALTPYQDMYLNVQVGNGNYQPQIRAKAGREYVYDISGNYQETRIYINGGNHLSAIGGLAPMYPYEFDLRALAHLKVLDIGTDDTTYTNTKFTTLGLETNKPLLETLNIKNCHSLGGAINLSNASNIRTVEAAGTAITTVNLPQYTNIETLHLPITATDISLYAARQLTDFAVVDNNGNIDYSRITKLSIVDSDYSENIDWIDIALQMIDNSETIKLLDLNIATINNLEDLEPFRTRKELIERGAEAIVLSGKITVEGEWSEIEKEQYETIWNDLTLLVIDDSTHKKVKHKLTYNYEIDGIARTYSIYVNNNAAIRDIYIDGDIPSMPSKAATAQYNYIFGSYDASNNYIELSGWRRRGASETLYEEELRLGYIPRVTDSTVIEPVFTEEARKYAVRWYLNRGDTTPVKSSSLVPYGGGETLEAPTVTDIQNSNRNTYSILFNREANPVTVQYRIFNGWDKLPIKINPSATDSSFNIYGNWIEGNTDLPTLFADTSNFTPEQLLVFAHMTDAERKLYADVGTQFTINTGYTGSDDGELLIGPGATHMMTNSRGNTSTYSIARFDSTSTNTRPFVSSIRPLSADNDEFTLAIDYSFDESMNDITQNEAVLVSCYESSTSGGTAGFKLYYGNYTNGSVSRSGPMVSFGDTTYGSGQSDQARLVGVHRENTTNRNTIVLRHPKGSKTLYVYSGINGNNQGNILTDMRDTTAIQEITWNNVNTNAQLTFGNITLNHEDDTIIAGKGIIYWAKYWNKDLGVGECRNLACWNHEPMTFAFEGYAGMDSRYGGRSAFPAGAGGLPNLVVTSVTSSNYGRMSVRATKTIGDVIQWDGSDLQKVANNRIFLSLPIALQSIITKSPVRSRAATMQQSGYTNSYTIGNSNVVRTNDYVFFPSSVEMGNTDSTYYKGYEAAKSMIWYNGGNTVVYKYNSGTTSWDVDDGNAQYMNLRFPIMPINTTGTNTVYYNYYLSDPIYDAIGGVDSIHRGDIFISSTGEAYMYVTAADVLAGAQIEIAAQNSLLYCRGGGGWIKASTHWTRSPYDNNGNYGTFMFIKQDGALQQSAVNPSLYGFNYSFSI